MTVFTASGRVWQRNWLVYKRLWHRSLAFGFVQPVLARREDGTVIGGHRLEWPPDAVVSVSASARWFVRDTRSMRRLHRIVETRSGRLFARRVLRTRISPYGWDPLPASPEECVADVAPLPLLVVHGDQDGYFPVAHAHALVDAASGPVELWLEPGFAHAETGASPDLVDRLGAHLSVLLERA